MLQFHVHLAGSRTTIYTELKRGTVIQIRQGKSQLVYLADSGQATYERHVWAPLIP